MAKQIRLDVDLISEELYQMLLKEFKEQHPEVGDTCIDNWSITAEVEDNTGIMSTLDKLYNQLQDSNLIEAEEMLGHVADWKAFFEDGKPLGEEG